MKEFEKLNPQEKKMIRDIISTLVHEPTQEEKEQRRQERERMEKERMEQEKHLAQVQEKCNTMTAEDYRRELKNIFEKMEWYKLRYFYVFITEKLRG